MSEFLWYIGVATCIKLLLIPSYHSTDFEVHRHWLALTHSLPLSEWYSDGTSQWTLDYPPFFAFFERFLSIFANIVDPTIVHIKQGLEYNSPTVVYFQRLTVIASDIFLFYAIHRLGSNLEEKKRNLMWALVVWSPMLVIVDHVHFQYNGFLLGWLLLSLSFLIEGRDLMGGFLFAVLLCFKHLFAVAAPVYFVYLLRHYCRGGALRGFMRLFTMGSVVIAVFAVAYGPFVYHGQMSQVFHRMFPFGRGLCHAYWAPNFWVFYIILDKVLAFVLRNLAFSIEAAAASFTGGLVGDTSPFLVLPRVIPLMTFLIVLLAISPCLVKAWQKPRPSAIVRWVSYAYTCGFLFGWHVHEKASLHFVIPLALTAVQSLEDAKHYFLLSIVSCYSLFPLLYETREYPVKVLLLLLHSMLMWLGFSSLYNGNGDEGSKLEKVSGAFKRRGFLTNWITKAYLLGLVLVELWGQFLHPYILGNRFPFLPLMIISVYCAVGTMYSWMWQLRRILRSSNS